ncbi:DEAD/DEAH box helicase family protein [Nocardioides sp. NPDC023903]|uniref:DEAD/DEAH box helicase n=1 Tax=Nocardioides sp. NPDC023903 TaxID=3157195 RepID=UPI0033E5B31D
MFESPDRPAWRTPQRGALGAVLGHWSVHRRRPALLAIPTGSGKTAIATALPYLAQASRVLVLVPSKQLRSQIADAFRTQHDLRRIEAVTDAFDPRVFEVTGRVTDWAELRGYDVVVGLPDSVSPSHYDDESKPPADLFDLVIIDEAHHTPAPTWRAVLDHFSDARKALLTATPRRRDGQRVPGELVYHFPLRAAISDGFYKAVSPTILSVPKPESKEECDKAICAEVARLFFLPEHSTSTLLIRVNERKRIAPLIAMYAQVGIDVVGLTSDLGEARRQQILAGLGDGTLRAVAVVGMLSEGFDLPRLRLAAYHDKHKSVAATIQLIGRLVRAHPDFPQPSELVTVQDKDVYPSLKDALWDLYQEDADWSNLLPGIIDDEVQDHLDDRAFSEALEKAPTQLSLESIRPVVRATVFEVRDPDWKPEFTDGAVPPRPRARESTARSAGVLLHGDPQRSNAAAGHSGRRVAPVDR